MTLSPSARTLFLTLIVLVFVSTVLAPVHAGYISISTRVSKCWMTDETGSCPINVSIVNMGDEAAYDARIVFLLPEGFTAENTAVSIGKLEVNRTMQAQVVLKRTKKILPGLYPGILLVEYKDANMRPFSAIVAFDIVQDTLTASPIKGVADEITLAGERSEKLKVKLKNSDDRGYKITATLFIPRELSATEIKKELEIPALGEGMVEFEISSFSALPGSTYPVFIAVTHEDGGQAYSTFVTGMVKVETESALFSTEKMMVVLAGLLIIFVLYQVRGRK